MFDAEYGAIDGVVSFGPFRLFLVERRLEKDGARVQLGSRALEILITLVDRAPEIVSKADLLARVWPNINVEDSNLRFHITMLRKALREEELGRKYITNVSGRGYCFATPAAQVVPKSEIVEAFQLSKSSKLPAFPTQLVGRDDAIKRISERLAERRFVTIVGPGGIGKTTVAVTLSHAKLAEFDNAVCFVSLGTISDPSLVLGTIASKLGLLVSSGDPTRDILRALQSKKMLLVFDSCEHVVETLAELSESIFRDAPNVHILATSREALRVNGEQIYRLLPLGCPPEGQALTAEEAVVFPAVQLFVEGVRASGYPFELNDTDAPFIGSICRKLDGIALAIEIAAGNVGAYGIQGTIALLDNQFRLFWQGRRTALPRHQTLCATLDWSHNLLPEIERIVLRRLAIFVGPFSIEAAQSVASGNDIQGTRIVEGIVSLVAKSLVATDGHGPEIRYRLLDTTRAYASRKLDESGEKQFISQQHSTYFCKLLEKVFAGSPLPKSDAYSICSGHVDNVRTALEWSHSENGDNRLAIVLTISSARLFLELSLFGECNYWTQLSIGLLNKAPQATFDELELQTLYALSLTFTNGKSVDIRSTYLRALYLAEELGESRYQLRLLGGFHIFLARTGDFSGGLAIARRSEVVAQDSADPREIAFSHLMLGLSNFWLGNLSTAHQLLELALKHSPTSRSDNFGYDQRIYCLGALAHTMWLRGSTDQALAMMRRALVEGDSLDHPVLLCICLGYYASLLMEVGDWSNASELIERLNDLAERYSLPMYAAIGCGFLGELCFERGETDAAIAHLRASREVLHSDRCHYIYRARFTCKLAEALAANQEFEAGLTVIGEEIDLEHKPSWKMPDMLRIKGEIVALTSGSAEGQNLLLMSLNMAREQSAQAFEIRTAVSLARVWFAQGRCREALQLLRGLSDGINEQFVTYDLKVARSLVGSIRAQSVGSRDHDDDFKVALAEH
jgi:predicted ATPase/DNA-binding winged helix-turn-helix (wHTH) protein